jgi:phosphohistidine phosphatase
MSRTLLLLRHGKSDWSTGADDFDRPLKKRGVKSALKIGNWLNDNKLAPDYIITSPAKRASQTARIISKCADIKKKAIDKDEHIYLASPEALLYVLENLPQQAKRVLLVGHNPGLEQLLYFLVNGQLEIPADGKILPTAALAVVEMPDKWMKLKNGSAKLTELIRPRELLDND